MASTSPDSRRPMQRRDSSRSSSKRRPRLLRASATEPSINTANVGRSAFTSPPPSRRATDLLSQVAYISGSSPDSLYRATSPRSAPSPIFDRDQRDEMLSSSPTSTGENLDDDQPYTCWSSIIDSRGTHPDHPKRPDAGRYFSFPSFDTWETDHGEKGEEEDRKAS